MIPALDGLRGLACLLVMYGHITWHFGLPYQSSYSSALGVAVFFVLSGFLMGYLYWPERQTWRFWAAFLIRRMARIYPVFVYVLLLCALAHEFLGEAYLRLYGFHYLPKILLLANNFEVPFYWTITTEVKFYLFYCLLVPALAALSRMTGFGTSLILGAAWIYLLFAAQFPPLNQYLGYNRIDLSPHLPYFIGGVFAGRIYHATLPLLSSAQLSSAQLSSANASQSLSQPFLPISPTRPHR